MNDEKKEYKNPELEITYFSFEDIISLSRADNMEIDPNEEVF